MDIRDWMLAERVAQGLVAGLPQPTLAAHESEPEPDVAIVPLGDYRRAHPDQAHCIIEVANSSVSKDRNIKAPLCAASGNLGGGCARGRPDCPVPYVFCVAAGGSFD